MPGSHLRSLYRATCYKHELVLSAIPSKHLGDITVVRHHSCVSAVNDAKKSFQPASRWSTLRDRVICQSSLWRRTVEGEPHDDIMRAYLSNKPPPGANEIATVTILPVDSSATTWNLPPSEPARSIARNRESARSSRPPVMARMVISFEHRDFRM